MPKSLLCPVTKHRIDLRFPERCIPPDAYEERDGVEDAASSGFFPIDEVSPNMLAPGFYEEAKDREQRIFADDNVFYSARLDTSGTLYELFADMYDRDDEVATSPSLSDEGDEAIPSHGSILRATCKPTPEQEEERTHRNTSTRIITRGKRREYELDDGTVVRRANKEMKPIFHRSHGLHGRKPAKPPRVTIRKMEAVDGAPYFMDTLYSDVMS